MGKKGNKSVLPSEKLGLTSPWIFVNGHKPYPTKSSNMDITHTVQCQNKANMSWVRYSNERKRISTQLLYFFIFALITLKAGWTSRVQE